MKAHEYCIKDYYGKNMLGNPCHVYVLCDHGVQVYKMNVSLNPDGTENENAKKVFYDRVSAIMEESKGTMN